MEFKSIASGSSGNAYLLDDGRTKLLIEAGISYKELQKRICFRTHELAGCLISHEHKDHSKAAKQLVKYGVNVYCSGGTAQTLGCDEVHIIEQKQEFSVGSYRILPFETFHDAAEPVGFLIRSETTGDKLLFATDTVNLAYVFDGLTLVALECNYDRRILERNERINDKLKKRIANTHFEVDNVCEYLKKLDLSNVRNIYLLHLSNACSNEAAFVHKIETLSSGIKVIACQRG